MRNQAFKSQACTCIIRMSNRPTKSVTDIMRLKTVLSKSVEVLQNISTNSQPFLQDQVDNKSLCIDQEHTQNTEEPCPRNPVSTVPSDSHTLKLVKDELEPIYTTSQGNKVNKLVQH